MPAVMHSTLTRCGFPRPVTIGPRPLPIAPTDSRTGAAPPSARKCAIDSAAVVRPSTPCTLTSASRDESGNGLRRRIASITLNIAAFAPVPSAIITMAASALPGARAMTRTA